MYIILTNLNISTLFHHCLVFVEVKRGKPIIGNNKSTISLDVRTKDLSSCFGMLDTSKESKYDEHGRRRELAER